MGDTARLKEAIILAGGFGTRLSHVVADTCKPMAPVSGLPFLTYILDALAKSKFKHVVIADGYKKEDIESYFGGSYKGIRIDYSQEDSPLGTGGAIKQALSRCHQPDVFVLNGDSFCEVDYDCMARDMAHLPEATALVAVKGLTDYDRYGSVNFDASHRIASFEEKAFKARGYINTGIYLLRKDSLDAMPDVFSFESDYLENVVSEGRVYAFVTEGLFIDIGIPEDYFHAESIFPIDPAPQRLAFFDRDGTINVDTGHLYEPSKLELIPKTIAHIREYNDDPLCKVIVVTNQAGIAKGIYSECQMHELHDYLDADLAKSGARVDAYYYCPHHPDYTGKCSCRKPESGMLEEAMREFGVPADNCIMYGDKETDRLAAERVGIKYVSVKE